MQREKNEEIRNNLDRLGKIGCFSESERKIIADAVQLIDDLDERIAIMTEMEYKDIDIRFP